ncbi:MAG: tRNA (adenosine(37)-N6)-threonylcarbamoyltransferase complex dimerization subunit type 1 TsaB [Endomicrobium sp.]|jgi:tRNA threonylcarbamoyladenosine biosynthesis protein TsaB|nr:tRNA (adenosine(37)-N6)-threonylcarbamoyltransferase complex dimerization subunit type 1 TsaB [Endomicrobium sp.]
MKILAIETSGKTFSIALNENNKTIVSFYYDFVYNIHSEMLIPVIERLLHETGSSFKSIDKFAVSIGPGSFTGIRIGITATKILAQTLNKPIVAIDTLSILEKSFLIIKPLKIIAAIDALRNEVYVKNSKGVIIVKNINSFIKNIKKSKKETLIIGNATITYKAKFIKELGKSCGANLPNIIHMPNAQTLAILAYQQKNNTTNYEEINPLYVRRSWAENNT